MTTAAALPKLAIIIPCLNEEENIDTTVNTLTQLLLQLNSKGKVSHHSYLCLVDDGSKDNTWTKISAHSQTNKVKGIKLSTNFGHQNALVAGLMNEMQHADCFVTIDADLQDDYTIIEQMVDQYQAGFNIVYGVRENRDSDTSFKRISAQLFYKLMHILGAKTITNHADFRLCDKLVLQNLEKFSETNLFLRGIFPLMGFKSVSVLYKRKERLHGKTKYPLRRMLSFAWQGVTSFNITPLRFVTKIGILMFLFSIITAVWALVTYLDNKSIQGWTSLLILLSGFSGLNMICLGIIGEYVAKIYFEVKQRPRYIIEQTTERPESRL
jgi:glycosyltransferase involved in cell wall biosynthesis